MARQLWIKNSAGVRGPLLTSEVRAMADRGQLQSEDLLSDNGWSWTRADKVKGLLKPRPSSESTSARSNPGPQNAWSTVSPTDHAGVGTSAGSEEIPWPIVREQRSDWLRKKQVFRLRPNEISILYTRRELTHEMLSAADMGAEGERFVKVSGEQIRAIHWRQGGYFTLSSLWMHFKLVTDDRHLQFQVPERDSENVIRALRYCCPVLVPANPARRTSGFEKFLIIFASLITILAAVMCFGVGAMAGAGIFASGAALTGIFALAAWIDARRSEFRIRQPRRLNRPVKMRRPFSSRTLGWTVKLLGLAYILWLAVFVDLDSITGGATKTYTGSTGLLYLPGIFLLFIGYRLCLKTFDPRRHPDPRPPVLFLRAFSDDGKKTLQPTSFLARSHGIFTYRDLWKGSLSSTIWVIHPVKIFKMLLNIENYTAEELLASAFRRCGPFVAIGRPGERLASAGADKMYVEDREWQKTVVDYIGASQATILQLSHSDGVEWELETVFLRADRTRVLLSLLSFKDRPNDFEHFRAWISRRHQIQLKNAAPFQKIPDLIYFDRDGQIRYQPICFRSPLLWTFTGSAIDTRRTFHSFIHGLGGRERAAPMEPKRHFGHGAVSIVSVFAFWVTLLTIGSLFITKARYQLQVAADIAHQDVVAAVRPAAKMHASDIVYRSAKMPFEFTLGSDWGRATDKLEGAEFDFSRGLERLTIGTHPTGKQSDFFSPSWAEEFRQGLEDRIAQTYPGTKVTLRRSNWKTINGTRWREMDLEQHYVNGTSEFKSGFAFYDPEAGLITVFYLSPMESHYEQQCQNISSTFRVPNTSLDMALNAAVNQLPRRYKGKQAAYSFSVNSCWQERDEAKLVQETPALQAAADAAARLDYYFELFDSNEATLGVEIDPGQLDFHNLDAVAKATLDQVADSTQSSFASSPDPEARSMRVKSTLLSVRSFTVDGHLWGEFKATTAYILPGYSRSNPSIYRMTNLNGKILVVSAMLGKDIPEIQQMVQQSLDSFQLDNKTFP